VFAAQVKANIGLSRTAGFKAFSQYLLSNETRATARRTGLIFETTRTRYAGNIAKVLRAQTVGGKVYQGANAISRLLPNYIQTASFMLAETKAARYAFQAEFMGRGLADRAHLNLADLAKAGPEEAKFAALLRARGFGPKEWDALRSTPPENGFITPAAVAAHVDEELGWRVAEMIERETRDAVPEPSLWAQTKLKFGTDPGSVEGELVRSLASYRSFSVTQTYRWSRSFAFRAWQEAQAAEGRGLDWKVRAAIMAAPLLITGTISGAAIVWAKDIVKGNDPRPLWDEADEAEAHRRAARFAGDAMLNGGGLGIFSDFFHSVEARNGKSSAMTAFGAPASAISDAYDYTFGNLNDAMSGKETHFGRDTANLFGRYNPLSSLWWSRMAFQRNVTDQMQRLLDPDADAAFDRKVKAMQRDYGMEPWWTPGDRAPSRAPDLGSILGQ
jgi:hypothetical protein